jgi:hypothetical protein
MNECKLPLKRKNAFLPIFLPLMQNSPWKHELGTFPRHHREKSTTKIQAKKSSQMNECKLPLKRKKCISPNFSSPDAKLPLEA